jgi:hypothetical protein
MIAQHQRQARPEREFRTQIPAEVGRPNQARAVARGLSPTHSRAADRRIASNHSRAVDRPLTANHARSVATSA